MPRRIVTQTAKVIATETALVVFVVLSALAYHDLAQRLESASETAQLEGHTHCVPQGEITVCEFGVDKP